MLLGRLHGAVQRPLRVDFSTFDTTVATYHNNPQQWWQEQGARMIQEMVAVISASGGDYGTRRAWSSDTSERTSMEASQESHPDSGLSNKHSRSRRSSTI